MKNKFIDLINAAIKYGKENVPDFEEYEPSDGYHTFNELYDFRKQYNAALFNEWALQGKFDVHKSKKHYEGEDCFGGGWFIVVAILPSGQISNHYKLSDWDLFKIPEVEKAKYPFDGHTPQDVLVRLSSFNSKANCYDMDEQVFYDADKRSNWNDEVGQTNSK